VTRLLSTFEGGEYSPTTLNFWRGSTSPTSARSHDRSFLSRLKKLLSRDEALDESSPHWDPSPFGCGEYSLEECSLAEYSPQNLHLLDVVSTPSTSAPWTSALPASTPPSEPSPFGGGSTPPTSTPPTSTPPTSALPASAPWTSPRPKVEGSLGKKHRKRGAREYSPRVGSSKSVLEAL